MPRVISADAVEWRQHGLPGDTPVYVIPASDWERLVELVVACGGRGSGPVEEIHAIISRTKEANGHE